MVAKNTYELTPKVSILEKGTMVETKCGFEASACEGINSADPEFEDAKQCRIPQGTHLLFVKDNQFLGAEQGKSLHAYFRCQVINDDGHVYWINLLTVKKAIWDFETYRGKKRLVEEAIDEKFRIKSFPLGSDNTLEEDEEDE